MSTLLRASSNTIERRFLVSGLKFSAAELSREVLKGRGKRAACSGLDREASLGQQQQQESAERLDELADQQQQEAEENAANTEQQQEDQEKQNRTTSSLQTQVQRLEGIF